MPKLIHDAILRAAQHSPDALALSCGGVEMSYGALASQVEAAARAMLALGLVRGERVAVYLDKCPDAVVAMFGAAAAGCAFVPLNVSLSPEQVADTLFASEARLLVTTLGRLRQLRPQLERCPRLHTALVPRETDVTVQDAGLTVLPWQACLRRAPMLAPHRCQDTDTAAIFYAEPGLLPKGQVLAHRELVGAAEGIARYLCHRDDDRLLAVQPFSADDGLCQLAAVFASGSCAVLVNAAQPAEIVGAVASQGVTGVIAAPATWASLVQQDWSVAAQLRYLASAGGPVSRDTLDAMRRAVPHARLYMMYGLDEAFRSTYLAPAPGDRWRDILQLRVPESRAAAPGTGPDGVAFGEPGAPPSLHDDATRHARCTDRGGACAAPQASVMGAAGLRRSNGHAGFAGRAAHTIEAGAVPLHPGAVEAVVRATGLVAEVAAFGVAHPALGPTVVLLARPRPGMRLDETALLTACRASLPAFMVPDWIELRAAPLARLQNGELDRRQLAEQMVHIFGNKSA